MSSLPPAGTVCCLLCRGVVAYRNLDISRSTIFLLFALDLVVPRFQAHMNYEHGAYFDMDFLLAACLMDDEERKAVRNVMELKHKAQQEKGKEVEERRGDKRAAAAPLNPPPPPPKPVPVVQVKEEASDEVRVLPEQWEGPKARQSFPCSMCDKTFLLQKYLQAHQSKTGHTNTTSSSPNTSGQISTPVLKCNQCSYSGSRPQDLRLHVTRKHGGEVETGGKKGADEKDTKGIIETNKPTNEAPGSLFSSLSTSWSQKKPPSEADLIDPRLKPSNEKEDGGGKSNSLQELSVASKVEEEEVDNPAPLDIDNVGGGPVVEATTFVAIPQTDSAPPPVVNIASSPPDQVDISKSKYFKANPQTLDVQVEPKLAEKFDQTDEKLPPGWKVKEIVHEFKSGRKETKKHFLTPDQRALKTGLAVLEYMRLSGKYSAKQIMDYAKYLTIPVNRLEKYMELYL